MDWSIPVSANPLSHEKQYMYLNEEQIAQVELQARAHLHNTYVTNIHLTEGEELQNFSVFQHVLRPELMSAITLARWLYFNNGLYRNKVVIDMGCGSGIQGITAGLYGAKKVLSTDIEPAAVANTQENVKVYNLEHICLVRQGNLFDTVPEKADIIIFNHPFFSDGTMKEQIQNPKQSLQRGTLIHVFLEQATNHILPGGCVVMPYYHLAGEVNDPGVQAPKHGYAVEDAWHGILRTCLQKGSHSIYILRPK